MIDAKTLNSQLSSALNSRVIIEQAKGIVSEATRCDMAQAFSRILSYARNRNLGLTYVANSVVDGTIRPNDLDGLAPGVQ
jgi:AmiR/NasT family two-component response regulator